MIRCNTYEYECIDSERRQLQGKPCIPPLQPQPGSSAVIRAKNTTYWCPVEQVARCRLAHNHPWICSELVQRGAEQRKITRSYFALRHPNNLCRAGHFKRCFFVSFLRLIGPSSNRCWIFVRGRTRNTVKWQQRRSGWHECQENQLIPRKATPDRVRCVS